LEMNNKNILKSIPTINPSTFYPSSTSAFNDNITCDLNINQFDNSLCGNTRILDMIFLIKQYKILTLKKYDHHPVVHYIGLDLVEEISFSGSIKSSFSEFSY